MSYDRIVDLEEHLEWVDAAVFSGDLLEVPAEHDMLRSYMNRWQGAVDQQRRNHWAEFTLTTALPMIKQIVQAELLLAMKEGREVLYIQGVD